MSNSMERDNLKKGDRVVVDKKFNMLVNIPIQTIKRIEGRFFWSEYFNAGDVKNLSHVIVNGKHIELKN